MLNFFNSVLYETIITENESEKQVLTIVRLLCESECTRLFKRHMNTNLFTYLQEYRIERSLEDLCKGKTISAAAEKAGFSDSNYYSKVFAKVKGCSPREYRKRQ